jgi:hypothetical protein
VTAVVEDTVLLPVPQLVVEAFDDALLIWDESGGKLHHLDLPAAIVWEELDGRSLAEVADGLAAEYETDLSLVRSDVLTLGDRLLTEGLVRTGDRSETHAFGREPGQDADN